MYTFVSQETTYVGTIIPVENLECIQCMAVATHRRQEVILDMTGRTFELEWDRNIKITIPDNTFSQTTRMTTKVNLYTGVAKLNNCSYLSEI